MPFTEKARLSTRPFKVSDYPRAAADIAGDSGSRQQSFSNWWEIVKEVLLREQARLDDLITRFEELVEELETSIETGLSSLESRIEQLESDVASIQVSITNLTNSLSAHISSTVAHGSDGDVVGENDLATLSTSTAFVSYSISSNSTSNLVLPSNVSNASVFVDVLAGAGSYTWSLNLSDSGRQAGNAIHMKISLPESENPHIIIYGFPSLTPLVNIQHDGIEGFINIEFAFDDSGNWFVRDINNLQTL